MFKSFEELVDISTGSETPAFIKKNIDVLYRKVFTREKRTMSFKKKIVHNYYLDYFIYRNKTKYKENLPIDLKGIRQSDILFHLNPTRKDYEDLIIPVSNKVAEKNISIAHLLNTKMNGQLSLLGYPNSYIFEEAIDSKVLYKAKKDYKKNILLSLKKWCSDNKVDSYYQTLLKQFYQKYVLDKHTMLIWLNLIQPKVIYSLHYIMKPGCLDAINSVLNKPKIFFIQHAELPLDLGFNDYKGADMVFLWGEYLKRALSETYDARPSVVLGNPKIEKKIGHLEKHKDNNIFNSAQTKKILYISSTPGLKSQHNIDCLKIFINAIKNQSFRIKYKLHPSEKIFEYELYMKRGLINNDQLITEQSILELIVEAEVVVGSYSTSIYEAMALKKPVIKIAPAQDNDGEEKGGLVCVGNYLTLKSELEKLLTDQEYYKKVISKQDQLVEDYFNGIKGASDRIANYLVKSINKLN